MAKRLQRKEPYGEVHGHPRARFVQDGYYFDVHGKMVDVSPENHPGPTKRKTPAKRKPVEQVTAEKNDAAIARAAEALGDISTSLPGGAAGSVPQEVQDAEKENAQALQAEENA